MQTIASVSDLPAASPLVTVAQFCKRHPAFTVGGMRHLLFQDPAGFRAACTMRFGRRVLIDEPAFFVWLAANRGRGNLFRSDPNANSRVRNARAGALGGAA